MTLTMWGAVVLGIGSLAGGVIGTITLVLAPRRLLAGEIRAVTTAARAAAGMTITTITMTTDAPANPEEDTAWTILTAVVTTKTTTTTVGGLHARIRGAGVAGEAATTTTTTIATVGQAVEEEVDAGATMTGAHHLEAGLDRVQTREATLKDAPVGAETITITMTPMIIVVEATAPTKTWAGVTASDPPAGMPGYLVVAAATQDCTTHPNLARCH